MATLDEQETTVTYVRSDDVVRVYTANPAHLRRLRKDDRATEIDGGGDWGNFTIPTAMYDPMRGFKSRRKPLTPEQREQAAQRLTAARNSRET